jgi:protocadherin-16/23
MCHLIIFFSFLFLTGEIFTKNPLDREAKAVHELQIEVKDQGNPPRSAKAIVRVMVTDVNDNTPVIVEPEETVLSVREELPAGTEVVRIRAVDTDEGNNASITYSFVIGEFCLLHFLNLALGFKFVGRNRIA